VKEQRISAEAFRADVLDYGRQVRVKPHQVTLRRMRKKWASCSSSVELRSARTYWSSRGFQKVRDHS